VLAGPPNTREIAPGPTQDASRIRAKLYYPQQGESRGFLGLETSGARGVAYVRI
jgi:hypothetical protein